MPLVFSMSENCTETTSASCGYMSSYNTMSSGCSVSSVSVDGNRLQTLTDVRTASGASTPSSSSDESTIARPPRVTPLLCDPLMPRVLGLESYTRICALFIAKQLTLQSPCSGLLRSAGSSSGSPC